MARRKKRLTLKKNSGRTADKKTPNGISAVKFANLAHAYGSFIVEDSHHELCTFATDEMAYIQHQDPEDDAVVPEEDYWIGTIREIRADNPDDVWVRVQWLWSPQEVAEVIKSFDPTICGKNEKLFSDNFDIISVHCFVDHVNVTRFEETSIYQVPIGEDEWFYRYEFLYVGKRISPRVTHAACSICKVPYTPSIEKIHHFCPRPGCCKFYHQECLIKHGYVEETHTHRVLETWPDVDRTVSLEELCGISLPKKWQKKKNPILKESGNDPLAGLPTQLIAIAGQQIVRGTQGGGIVGNITAVAAARQLIFRTLSSGGVIPDDWETMIDTSAAFPELDILPNCTCPSCYSPI